MGPHTAGKGYSQDSDTSSVCRISVNETASPGVTWAVLKWCVPIRVLGGSHLGVRVGWQKRPPWLLTTGPLSCPLDAPWKPTVNGTVVAVEGETVSILCSTQSNPDPILTIFKEKQILATVIYESELQLELPAVTPEDDGEYWCVAENQYGQRATAFNLSVECKYLPLQPSAPDESRWA